MFYSAPALLWRCTGGASWSGETAAAAVLGALASGPLVALYAGMWVPSARSTFLAVDSRQNGVASTLRPILNNLSWLQARSPRNGCSLADACAWVGLEGSVALRGIPSLSF